MPLNWTRSLSILHCQARPEEERAGIFPATEKGHMSSESAVSPGGPEWNPKDGVAQHLKSPLWDFRNVSSLSQGVGSGELPLSPTLKTQTLFTSAEQRPRCSLYCLNCLVNFPPNLEHDSSKKIMFSMSYTLFPWCLTVDVGTKRDAWQASGPTHRPHTGESPVPVFCTSAWTTILLHSGEPTSPQRWHTGSYDLAGARLGYMPEVHCGQGGSCLLAPAYQMPSESPGQGALRKLTPRAGQCLLFGYPESPI